MNIEMGADPIEAIQELVAHLVEENESLKSRVIQAAKRTTISVLVTPETLPGPSGRQGGDRKG
jgi:hypothetical protein